MKTVGLPIVSKMCFRRMVLKINYFMRIYFNCFYLFIEVVLEDDCENMNNT